MRTIGVTMWMADAGRHLARRVKHLSAKVGVDEWIWVVRPTADMTDTMLRAMADENRAKIVLEDWPQSDDRILCLAVAADQGVAAALARGADRILWHESDLITSADVVQMLERTPAAVVGGWPVLPGEGTPKDLMLFDDAATFTEAQFYDTWGYRLDGVRYTNEPPHHPRHVADKPYQLDSVGSVALLDASYARSGARFAPGAFVRYCEWVVALGGTVWCDPRVPVVQPLELWNFNDN